MPRANDLLELKKADLRDTLLRARREERVPPSLRRKLLTMTATTMSSTSPATEPTADSAPSSNVATPRGSLILWKLAGTAMLGSLLVTTFDDTNLSPNEPAVRPAQTAAAAREDLPRSDRNDAVPLEPPTTSTPPAPTAPPARSVGDRPTARRNGATPSKVANVERVTNVTKVEGNSPSDANGATTTASGDMRIMEQIRIVEASRAAIHAGHPSRALEWLDTYDVEFPMGALHEEALVLRIESFVRLGRHREATEHANAFLQSRPRSPYVARVRDSLSAAGAESRTAP